MPCTMVPDTLLVILLAISTMVSLIGFTNSGTTKDESISIATTPPFSKQTSLDHTKNGPASSEAGKTTALTNDKTVKDHKLDESVEKFDTQADRVGSFPSKHQSMQVISIHKPSLSDLSVSDQRLNATYRTIRLMKRNAIERNVGSVELGKQVKREEGAKVNEKVGKKRVKRMRYHEHTKTHKGPPAKETESISVDDTNHEIGLIVESSNKKAEQESAVQEDTIIQVSRREAEVLPPRIVYRPPLRDYYLDRVYDYYNDDYPEKKKAEKAEGKKETAGDTDTDTRQRRKKANKTSKKGKKPKKTKKTKKTSSSNKDRQNEDLNDYDDKIYFAGGNEHAEEPIAGEDHIVHDAMDYGDFDLSEYSYDLQRSKRESGDDDEEEKLEVNRDIEESLPPPLNHSSDSMRGSGIKSEVKDVQSERGTGVQYINGTSPHPLLPSVSSNTTSASVTAETKTDPPTTTHTRRTPMSVTMERLTRPPRRPRPRPPVMLLALCSDKVCTNGGTCLRSAIRGGIICICPTGYSGKTCDNRLDPCIRHLCQNGATCISPHADKTILPMRCQCPAGFSGQLCQIDVNECSSDPCLNGARCVDRVDGYSCQCLRGFEGQRCETNTDDCLGRICANGGRCVDGLNRYRCHCRPGFFGRHCQRVSDACLRSPCFNGGECIAMDSRGHFYKCLCRTGYLGSRCEIQAAKCVHSWCQNGGTCMEAAGSFQCLCPPGLTGNLCESEVTSVHKCQSDTCQRRGTCVDTSAGFRCECPSEAVGDRCQFDGDACLPNPCVNGGLCIPTGGPSYFCLCDQRFAGKICQFETRPCAGNKTCENGGTCLDYHLQRKLNLRGLCVGEKCRGVKENVRKDWTVIRCVCPLLYTGPRCTIRNLPCTIGVCSAGQECKEDPHNPVEGYSCLDKTQSEVPLTIVTNQNQTVEDASPGQVQRRKVSNTTAILFGSALIVTIFGIAFLASGYTYCRSKEDSVCQPVRNDKKHIISDIRTHMENPRT